MAGGDGVAGLRGQHVQHARGDQQVAVGGSQAIHFVPEEQLQARPEQPGHRIVEGLAARRRHRRAEGRPPAVCRGDEFGASGGRDGGRGHGEEVTGLVGGESQVCGADQDQTSLAGDPRELERVSRSRAQREPHVGGEQINQVLQHRQQSGVGGRVEVGDDDEQRSGPVERVEQELGLADGVVGRSTCWRPQCREQPGSEGRRGVCCIEGQPRGATHPLGRHRQQGGATVTWWGFDQTEAGGRGGEHPFDQARPGKQAPVGVRPSARAARCRAGKGRRRRHVPKHGMTRNAGCSAAAGWPARGGVTPGDTSTADRCARASTVQ